MDEFDDPKLPEDLTQEEYNKIFDELDKFERKFFVSMAGTDRYEIVPTSDGDSYLTKNQYTLIKAECDRLGLKIIYRIENNNTTMYFNSENGKIGYTHDGVH